MGVIGGGVFQAIKGFRNAPVGMRHRLRGSVNAVRIRAPQIGGERFGETGVITELGMLAPWSLDCKLRVQILAPTLPGASRGSDISWQFHTGEFWSLDPGPGSSLMSV